RRRAAGHAPASPPPFTGTAFPRRSSLAASASPHPRRRRAPPARSRPTPVGDDQRDLPGSGLLGHGGAEVGRDQEVDDVVPGLIGGRADGLDDGGHRAGEDRRRPPAPPRGPGRHRPYLAPP